jgi:putative acyl-CoA dehydrogenase
MAYAAIAGFSGKPQFATWRERTLAADYDPRRLPIEAKRAAVIGYAMTEKQGGSDLRETQTTARFIERGAHGEIYSITGHKWFFSVPVADGFYTLARTESGVSCLFVPRLLPDGSANRIFIQRLKDKCGNRSNASSEIEYHDTWSILVGEEGARHQGNPFACASDQAGFRGGFRRTDAAGLEPGVEPRANANGVSASRCPSFPCSAMCSPTSPSRARRRCLAHFGVARATDGLQTSEHERLLARVATPVVKFWNCQRAPAFSYECLQVHGGNGFIMENAMARLYREAPLNSIWEGTSNMMCMDVCGPCSGMHAAGMPSSTSCGRAGAVSRIYDRSTEDLADRLRAGYPDDGHARALVDPDGACVAGCRDVAAWRCRCRRSLREIQAGRDGMHVFGALPSSEGLARIVERASVIRH